MRTVASLTIAFSCLVAALFAVPTLAAASALATASGKSRLDNRERAMVRGINAKRAAHGLAAVKVSGRLAQAADYHSWEMLDADYFAHPSRNGESFDRRVRRYANHRALGETLAWLGGCGRHAARRIVRMWMNSPGHREIILSGKFRRIGVAKRTGNLAGRKACVVTADFASKK